MSFLSRITDLIEVRFREVNRKLDLLLTREKILMMNQDDLNQAIAGLTGDVASLESREAGEDQADATEIAALHSQITDLEAQLAAAQAGVDTTATVQAITDLRARLNALENAPPVPAPAPPAATGS